MVWRAEQSINQSKQSTMSRQPVATTAPAYFYQYPHQNQQHAVYAQQQHHPVQQFPSPYHEPILVQQGYRQVELPFRHLAHAQQFGQLNHLQQQKYLLQTYQQQQQHVSPLAAPSFHHHSPSADFPPHYHQPPTISLRTRQHHHAQQRSEMAYQAGATSEEDMAAMQKLSDNYEPEITGPLVGQREPSTAITAEYASADPVFQAKTASLPQKYSHYRKMRGDGKCGWRAIAFGYFEALIHYGDEHKFNIEEARLHSLHNILNNAGYSPYLYEDFADAVFDVLRKLSGSLQAGNSEELLLESFNDENEQNYIITYFKTLTSAWMKTRESEYTPWLEGQTVTAFVDSQVMPIGSEIDNVSMSALKDVLLSSANIQLEVLYLDRTDGVEPNMHRFDPQDSSQPPIGSIRLLYRPGHYDIVYKTEDVPQTNTSVQTYLQYHNETHNEPVIDLGMSDFMTMIPGMSYASSQQSWMPGTGYGYSDYLASPPSSMPAPVESPELQSRTQPMYAPASRTHMIPPPDEMPLDMAIRSGPHEEAQSHFNGQSQTSPFRFSCHQFEPGFVSASSHVPFKTAIFKNSHFNTAHFLNPDFQPEEWRPEDESMCMTKHGKGGRHSSFG